MATFVLLLNYVRPLTEVDALISQHKAFLDAHYEAGHFLLSGRKEPRTGGVILARAESKAAIEAIVQQDPFAIAGVAQYEIVEFVPTMSAAELRTFLS